MAYARAGVGVVVAESGTNHLLDDVDFLVGAARGRDATDGVLAVFGLDGLEAVRRESDRLVPADLAPRIGDLVPHHRRSLTILMRGIAEGKAALDAGVALVGPTVLVRNHADHLVAVHLGLEATAHATIGAGGEHGLGRRTVLDDRLFDQRRRRAGLHAGAAGDAFGGEEAFVHAGGDMRSKTAPVDGKRERALHFLASAHAARADDAFGRLELEIGVTQIFRRRERQRIAIGKVSFAVHAVAHFAQARDACHVLKLAIAVGAAGKAIERMVGDVKLHHALANLLQPLGLSVDHDARRDGRGAGCGRALAAVDLNQAQPA